MQQLSVYIKHPDYIDAQVVDELKLLVDSYPYFHAARMLMLQGMFRLCDERFGAELRKAAIYVPDRKQLYALTEGTTLTIHDANDEEDTTAVESQQQDKEDGSRTSSLIDAFLGTLPEAPPPRRQRPIDASVDYLSYVMQEEGPAPWTPTLPDTSSSASTSETEESSSEDTSEETNMPSEACFTETLAQIYIKQGKYEKALDIIRRLNLNFPKKSRYFADQIRFLEKLVANEQRGKIIKQQNNK